MTGAINSILQVLLLGTNMRARFAFKRDFLVALAGSENLLVNSFVKNDDFLSYLFFFLIKKRNRK